MTLICQGFLGYDTKNIGNKKQDKWDHIKLKIFCTVKETKNRVK